MTGAGAERTAAIAAAVETFVRDVVDFYWTGLTKAGHIPQRMHEILKVDLVQDVQDMLRAKIYGHYGIGEYNRLRRKKSS